jgi:hypothetical protein
VSLLGEYEKGKYERKRKNEERQTKSCKKIQMGIKFWRQGG